MLFLQLRYLENIIYRGFKLGQLIEDDVDYLVKIYVKEVILFYSNYCPLQICYQDISKTVTAKFQAWSADRK